MKRQVQRGNESIPFNLSFIRSLDSHAKPQDSACLKNFLTVTLDASIENKE